MSRTQVLLLSGDLMFASRMEPAARQAGLTLVHVFDAATARTSLGSGTLAGVVLDLNWTGLTPAEVVAALPPPRPLVCAYGPHVAADLLASARDAGCDEVWPRGRLNSEWPQLCARFAAETRESA